MADDEDGWGKVNGLRAGTTSVQWSPDPFAPPPAGPPRPAVSLVEATADCCIQRDAALARARKAEAEVERLRQARPGKVEGREALERRVAGALRDTINAHGDITTAKTPSATKRIIGALWSAGVIALATDDEEDSWPAATTPAATASPGSCPTTSSGTGSPSAPTAERRS